MISKNVLSVALAFASLLSLAGAASAQVRIAPMGPRMAASALLGRTFTPATTASPLAAPVALARSFSGAPTRALPAGVATVGIPSAGGSHLVRFAAREGSALRSAYDLTGDRMDGRAAKSGKAAVSKKRKTASGSFMDAVSRAVSALNGRGGGYLKDLPDGMYFQSASASGNKLEVAIAASTGAQDSEDDARSYVKDELSKAFGLSSGRISVEFQYTDN